MQPVMQIQMKMKHRKFMKKGSMKRVKIAVKKEPADSAEDGVYMTATPHGLRYGTEKSVQQR